jgi:hypothetical protein
LFFNKNRVEVILPQRKPMPTDQEKVRQQRIEWAEMQRRGHFRFVMEQIFSMIGTLAAIQVVWHLLAKAIGRNYFLDTMVDTVSTGFILGILVAEYLWFYMKRKFRIPPPEEDWMAR